MKRGEEGQAHSHGDIAYNPIRLSTLSTEENEQEGNHPDYDLNNENDYETDMEPNSESLPNRKNISLPMRFFFFFFF